MKMNEKMADVFKLPLRAMFFGVEPRSVVVNGIQLTPVAAITARDNKVVGDAIAHAVNCHDALVAKLTEAAEHHETAAAELEARDTVTAAYHAKRARIYRAELEKISGS